MYFYVFHNKILATTGTKMAEPIVKSSVKPRPSTIYCDFWADV
jgi:hypothetical protein